MLLFCVQPLAPRDAEGGRLCFDVDNLVQDHVIFSERVENVLIS